MYKPENETQIFWCNKISPNPDEKTIYGWLSRKIFCRLKDFAVPAAHRAKIKESQKIDKYLELMKERKKKNFRTWEWRWYQLYLVQLEWSPKDLEKRLEDLENRRRIDTLQTRV